MFGLSAELNEEIEFQGILDQCRNQGCDFPSSSLQSGTAVTAHVCPGAEGYKLRALHCGVNFLCAVKDILDFSSSEMGQINNSAGL